MEHQLRPATASDRDFLYGLHCATMREAIAQTWGWDETWQRTDFEARFQRCEVSVIEIDGRATGAVWLEWRPAELYVTDLQILPELQGRGAGTAVLREIIAKAATLGIPVALQVLRVNRRAQRLYERLGFRVTATSDTSVHMRHAAGEPGAA
jgi:ribosomal protein S18 acetylase RimI-like enzyme